MKSLKLLRSPVPWVLKHVEYVQPFGTADFGKIRSLVDRSYSITCLLVPVLEWTYNLFVIHLPARHRHPLHDAITHFWDQLSYPFLACNVHASHCMESLPKYHEEVRVMAEKKQKVQYNSLNFAWACDPGYRWTQIELLQSHMIHTNTTKLKMCSLLQHLNNLICCHSGRDRSGPSQVGTWWMWRQQFQQMDCKMHFENGLDIEFQSLKLRDEMMFPKMMQAYRYHAY